VTTSRYVLRTVNIGHFIMFFMITKIYNKENIRPTLMGFFHRHRKTKKVFFDD